MNEEQKELLSEIKSQTKEVIQEKLADYITGEQLEKMEKFAEAEKTEESLKNMQEVVSEMEVTLKAMKEAPSKKDSRSMLQKELSERQEEMKELASKRNGNFHISTKAFDTGTNFGVWTDFLEPLYVDGIIRTPDRQADFNVLQYVTVGTTPSEIVKWIEEDTEAGTANFIDECVVKPDVSKNWVRNSAEVKKVADFTRICDEVLLYLEWAQQEIELFLRKLVYKAIQDAIINGDGVGENLLGITPQATAFVAGGLAASTPDANEADAVAAIRTQIANQGYAPNYAFVNILDLYKMNQALKASDGQYLENRAGIALIDCPFIPAGSVLVGDFSKSNVRFKQEITVDMGYNEDDFKLNAISMRAEAFLTHYIGSNDANAFVYDTYANVIAAIDKP